MVVPGITRSRIGALLLGVVLAPTAWAQPAATDNSPVTRDEYLELKQDLENTKSQVRELQKQNADLKSQLGQKAEQPDTEKQQYLEYLDKQLQDVKAQSDANRVGSTSFVISGYASVGFNAIEHSNNTFTAGFNPILLWQINDRLLFESEVEIALPEDQETEVNLEFGNMSYAICDYLTVGGGKFLTPFGIFPQYLHPAWINKLPDFPLVYNEDGGLAPFQQLGVFVRGAAPIGQDFKVKYDFYVSNGPTLVIDGDAASLGRLDATNNVDLNDNKAVGGRVGFLPLSELELTYSILGTQASPDDFQTVNAILQAVGANYKKEIEQISGTLQVLAEYDWWSMDKATYDAAGDVGGPFTFANNRNGGYLQLAYRPTRVDSKILKNLEGVFRYDIVNEPSAAPDRFDEQRYTIGMNYWVTSSMVVKAAYEIDDTDGAPDASGLLLQAALGF